MFSAASASAGRQFMKEHTEKLESLVGKAPQGLAGPRAKYPAKPPAPAMDFDFAEQDMLEEPELEEELDPACALQGAVSAGDTDKALQLMVVRMAQKMMKKKEVMSSDEESGEKLATGARGCVARQRHIKVMQAHPGRILEEFRQKLSIQMEVPRDSLYSAALRGFYERKCPLGTHKLLTYAAWSNCHQWEAAEDFQAMLRKQPVEVQRALRPTFERLQMQIMLFSLFIDQTAVGNGRYTLSWLMTALPQPPFSVVRAHTERYTDEPFSVLADARWVAANL
eukprot:2062499-Amphidinium_carterae.9